MRAIRFALSIRRHQYPSSIWCRSFSCVEGIRRLEIGHLTLNVLILPTTGREQKAREDNNIVAGVSVAEAGQY